jgi:hypothetical protein
MNSSTQHSLNSTWHFVIAASLLFSSAHAEPPLPAEPNLKEVASRGRATLERLQKETATWKAIFPTPASDRTFEITTIQAPNARKLTIDLILGSKRHELAQIIERDNAWYVTSDGASSKYRRFEAPLPLPLVYHYIALSELRYIIDETPIGTFEGLNGQIATYRVVVSEPQKSQLERALKSLELSAQGDSGRSSIADRKVQQVRDLLANGSPSEIDIENGIFASAGAMDRRYRFREFRWLEGDNSQQFMIDESKFIDHTAAIVDETGSRQDLVMMAHAGAWSPGLPTFDTDAQIVNMRTHELRRVPFSGGVSHPGCFSKDRSSVYICGQNAAEGAFGLFQIDLRSGETRQLGQNGIIGLCLHPVVSPDGKTLAVAGNLTTYSDPLASQIFLIDIESGTTRTLGEPMDTAFHSWVPDGSGLILITRKHVDLNKPSVDTIARMDLTGKITPIRSGSSPVVLHPDQRILYLDKDDDLWKSCDLNGKELGMFGDGLKRYAFPSVAPDGKWLIMMHLVEGRGPTPHLIDIATGQPRPLEFGPGLWAIPSWR